MKKQVFFVLMIVIIMNHCSLHFDVLGKDKIEEVVLVQSKAKEKILIIDVSGIIGMTVKPSMLNRESDIVSRVYSRLQMASDDQRIKGVILRLDTPGGEVTASDILYNEVRNFRKETGIPVVSLMMGVAASGGYYIAAASDHIIAHPSTITGSIGVISLFPNLEELFTKIGIEVNVIKSGEMKDSGSAFRDMTADDRAVFQAVVDELYQRFLDVVVQGRDNAFSLEELKPIADGRIYTAHQALELKLIDEIGYFDSALAKVKSMANITDAQVITFTHYPKKKTNIYAKSLDNSNLIDTKDFKDLFQSLKSGFYYLWLPQLSN
ncbi:signal peptide peptidase SppA [Acidobacteriota bacterium]